MKYFLFLLILIFFVSCGETKTVMPPNCDAETENSILQECTYSNKTCIVVNQVATCDECFVGYKLEGEECVKIKGCSDLNCEAKNKYCEHFDKEEDAECVDCKEGFKTVGELCEPVITCEDLNCNELNKKCNPAGKHLDAEYGSCLDFFKEDESEADKCTSVTTCEDLACKNKACLHNNLNEDAVCSSSCLTGYHKDDTDACVKTKNCYDLFCFESNQTCIESTPLQDARCGRCLGGFIEDGTECKIMGETTCDEKPATGSILTKCKEEHRDITEDQISNMFNAECDEGSYMQGYDDEGMVICKEDKTGNSESVIYTVGAGIEIDENHNISAKEYTAGNGIKIESNYISIDSTKVASALHNHNNLYYSKSNNATHNSLVKFSGTSGEGYTLESTGITEENGELTVNNLISPNIEVEDAKITNLGQELHPITNATITTANINVANLTIVNSSQDFSNLIRTNYIQFANESDLNTENLQVHTHFKGFTVVETANISTWDGIDITSADAYINNDGTTTTDRWARDTNGVYTVLTAQNSFCALAQVSFSQLGGAQDAGVCNIEPVGLQWRVNAYSNHSIAQCRARCLIWAW